MKFRIPVTKARINLYRVSVSVTSSDSLETLLNEKDDEDENESFVKYGMKKNRKLLDFFEKRKAYTNINALNATGDNPTEQLLRSKAADDATLRRSPGFFRIRTWTKEEVCFI